MRSGGLPVAQPPKLQMAAPTQSHGDHITPQRRRQEWSYSSKHNAHARRSTTAAQSARRHEQTNRQTSSTTNGGAGQPDSPTVLSHLAGQAKQQQQQSCFSCSKARVVYTKRVAAMHVQHSAAIRCCCCCMHALRTHDGGRLSPVACACPRAALAVGRRAAPGAGRHAAAHTAPTQVVAQTDAGAAAQTTPPLTNTRAAACTPGSVAGAHTAQGCAQPSLQPTMQPPPARPVASQAVPAGLLFERRRQLVRRRQRRARAQQHHQRAHL